MKLPANNKGMNHDKKISCIMNFNIMLKKTHIIQITKYCRLTLNKIMLLRLNTITFKFFLPPNSLCAHGLCLSQKKDLVTQWFSLVDFCHIFFLSIGPLLLTVQYGVCLLLWTIRYTIYRFLHLRHIDSVSPLLKFILFPRVFVFPWHVSS